MGLKTHYAIFTLQPYIYDGLTGQLLEQPLPNTGNGHLIDEAVVDPMSQDFWQSSYGMEIMATMNR